MYALRALIHIYPTQHLSDKFHLCHMQVMKFGGASVKNAASVQNVARIIRALQSQGPILAVISAMDKTTNHLEQLAWAARDGREAETLERFAQIQGFHMGIVSELFPDRAVPVYAEVQQYFAEVQRVIQGILLLGEFPPRTYDRIVSYGELISSSILSHYLRQDGLPATCVDARQLIRTDARYTQAQVIWSVTREQIQQKVLPMFTTTPIIVTQGFIASSTEGKITTLGREGSDYTASIFATCLDAQSLTVWKDVAGVLTGDPRIEPHTQKLDALSYERAVEMTFYGATVIHPKTIRPIRNAGIPMHVKCFMDMDAPGTVIAAASAVQQDDSACIRIWRKNQALLSITARDFSFMDEQHLGKIFALGARTGLAINLVQVTAITLHLCVNWVEATVQEFATLLLEDYAVEQQPGQALRTFINFDDAAFESARRARVVQIVDNKLLAVLPE